MLRKRERGTCIYRERVSAIVYTYPAYVRPPLWMFLNVNVNITFVGLYRKLPNFKSSTISSSAKTQGKFLERKNAEREKVVFKSKISGFTEKKKEIQQDWKARNIITMAAHGSKKASLQTSLHDLM